MSLGSDTLQALDYVKINTDVRLRNGQSMFCIAIILVRSTSGNNASGDQTRALDFCSTFFTR